VPTIQTVNVRRTATVLLPDPTRVLLRAFIPGDAERISGIIVRILNLDEATVETLLASTIAAFASRHKDLQRLFKERFLEVWDSKPPGDEITESRKSLIGSYFLSEYSIESAALFNPSIVPHPDQSLVPAGCLRFILSLRATGEGHISSITFRTGILQADQRIEIVTPTGLLTEPKQIPNALYETPLFTRKLAELGIDCSFTQAVMRRLGAWFTLKEIRHSLDTQLHVQDDLPTASGIWSLVRSNHEVQFQQDQELSERILFPATPSQRNGIEDARFVRFVNDDGTVKYFATFTAYDGKVVMPELVETEDFLRFRFTTLNGPAAINKGMALFPRKIRGHFAMLGRQDSESISLMYSDNVHFWDLQQPLLLPRFPWELVQLGNCGSPLETEAGWLVLSHGVGPMREYAIGAFLLDLEDPSKVIGRLSQPLLTPNQNEREGYVPNVVYSCGGIIHGEDLILPYGMSDRATGFALIPVKEILAAMEPCA
jgi:predicted GH43/DUF377 family glycosyl hydrolase